MCCISLDDTRIDWQAFDRLLCVSLLYAIKGGATVFIDDTTGKLSGMTDTAHDKSSAADILGSAPVAQRGGASLREGLADYRGASHTDHSPYRLSCPAAQHTAGATIHHACIHAYTRLRCRLRANDALAWVRADRGGGGSRG